jgi:hypothetical protein
MQQQFHYATVTEAIKQLKEKGFTLDLNLKENQFLTDGQAYAADEFEIVDLYRYEGASDPADEATVYALASKSGLKGILVSGYGTSTDDASEETLKQLHYKYQQGKQ